MAESTLSDDYADIRSAIGRHAGYGSASGNWGAAATEDTQAWQIERALKRGQRKFLMAHNWGFLKITDTISTQAPYSTGTVTFTNGDATVEGTGTTFPTWIDKGVVNYLGRSYGIASRTDADTFEMDNTWPNDTASAVTYSIDQRDYDMPDSFGYLDGDITYETGNYRGEPLRKTGEGEIRRYRQRYPNSSGKPTIFAIRPKVLDLTVGQRWEAMFWPTPNAEYVLHYPYSPLYDALTASNIYAAGGMPHAETLVAACLYEFDLDENDARASIHEADFMKNLQRSIDYDGRTRASVIGQNLDRSDEFSRPGVGRRGKSLGTSYNGTFY